ncbi:MAG: hypothetical protein ACXW3O_07240 [Brevundimonas sp.]
MAKLQTILTAVLASSAIGGSVFAQDATPITNRDVVGDWTLTITPAERRDLDISVQSADGSQPDFPLTITAQASDRLACVVRDRPAECRIRNGELVIVSTSSSGGARMTFTLTDRARGGFRGAARMNIRFLPVGGHIGSVIMARR